MPASRNLDLSSTNLARRMLVDWYRCVVPHFLPLSPRKKCDEEEEEALIELKRIFRLRLIDLLENWFGRDNVEFDFPVDESSTKASHQRSIIERRAWAFYLFLFFITLISIIQQIFQFLSFTHLAIVGRMVVGDLEIIHIDASDSKNEDSHVSFSKHREDLSDWSRLPVDEDACIRLGRIVTVASTLPHWHDFLAMQWLVLHYYFVRSPILLAISWHYSNWRQGGSMSGSPEPIVTFGRVLFSNEHSLVSIDSVRKDPGHWNERTNRVRTEKNFDRTGKNRESMTVLEVSVERPHCYCGVHYVSKRDGWLLLLGQIFP